MAKLFAYIGDPDQTPRNAASDLGLHCLSITLLGVSRLQWVKLPLHIIDIITYYSTYPLYNPHDYFTPKSDILVKVLGVRFDWTPETPTPFWIRTLSIYFAL